MNYPEITHRSISHTDNIFDLPEPESHSCSTERYKAGLSELVIQLFKGENTTDPAFELVFNSPYYFCGPFGWAGANFRIADESKKIALGRQLGWLGDTDQIEATKYLDGLTLFEVETATGFTVEILASSAFRVDR